MFTWLLLITGLYMAMVFLPSLFLIPQIGISAYVGSRDDDPTESKLHGRAQRAVDNFRENYPVVMGLGILALIVPEVDQGMATKGAMIFAVSRVVYLPLYLAAVPYLRSVAFTVGWAGMVMMLLALI